MGDERPRGEMLAERLHLYGAIPRGWREMSALEQDAIARAVADYDDDVGNVDSAREAQALREKLDEIEREQEEERERREAQDVAIVEDGDGGAEITFRGQKIEGVTRARLEWDEEEPTRLALRVKSIASPVLAELDRSHVELTIETTFQAERKSEELRAAAYRPASSAAELPA